MATRGVRAQASLIWGTPEENGKTYEVIDGELYVYPIPWWTHQFQLSNLGFFVTRWVHDHNLGYVVGAGTAVVLDQYTGVQPDLLYISSERNRVIANWGVDGPPDLVVEVLSPWTEARDRGLKLRRYAAAGVAHYWILDTDGPRIEERILEEGDYRLVGTFGPGEIFRPTLFPGLEIPLDEIAG
jgi:Uma2 family endonuclease